MKLFKLMKYWKFFVPIQRGVVVGNVSKKVRMPRLSVVSINFVSGFFEQT